ncbi:MAG: hypothetical protein H6R27_156 [Proteobacteria bacterium]|nr:hypothetical protein [Pseudomonadota bacterium]
MARDTLKLVALAVTVAATVLALSWLGLRWLDDHRNDQPIAGLEVPRVVTVEPGSALRTVAVRLADQGLLEHPGSWVRLARRQGVAGQIRAGEFEVAPGATPRSLLEQIVSGRVLLHALTIPEGWTFREALSAIQQHPAIRPVLRGPGDPALRETLGLGERSVEGMLFPDTYRFPRGTRDVDLLRQAHARLERELAAAWEARLDDLPFDSPYEALILASIIEKETGAPDERPLIAGVFANRLRLGMRLQTDPTVIYGLGDTFDGNLRRADLDRDTPYNTYTRAGLPPTPIALPGREALRAAAAPADTEALYFVATGRGDGRHLFARTLAEHNGNVARYIATLRSTQRQPVR